MTHRSSIPTQIASVERAISYIRGGPKPRQNEVPLMEKHLRDVIGELRDIDAERERARHDGEGRE